MCVPSAVTQTILRRMVNLGSIQSMNITVVQNAMVYVYLTASQIFEITYIITTICVSSATNASIPLPI